MAPAPDTAGTFSVYAALRPTPTATETEQFLYTEFTEVVYHGVLYYLKRMPERPWSDAKDAILHGKQWTHFIASARDRADRGYNKTSLSVQMRPFA